MQTTSGFVTTRVPHDFTAIKTKAAHEAALMQYRFGVNPERLTLACFEAALGFVDYVYSAFTAHHAAVAVAVLQRAQRVFNLHGLLLRRGALDAPVAFCPMGGSDGGHDWDRTSDPYDVNVVLYR
jgi:hypothetical protein